MRRVGAEMPAAEFAATVADAFNQVCAISDREIGSRFRRTRGYANFRALLRQAAPPAGARILAIGCAPSMAGRGAVYAASVVRECYPGAAVEVVNVGNGRGFGGEERGFDLVVTNSFLHYVNELQPVCEWIRGLLRSGGRYLMAHEFNARYWRNAEIVREMERVEAAESRRRQLLKYVSPGRYVAKARSVLLGESGGFFARTNQLLRQRLSLRGDLTEREITLILEPHIDGLDWAELESGPLAGMRLETVRTSAYLIRNDPPRLPLRWRKLNEDLAARYPLDGRIFSALWRLA